jgi:hypothetical protein
MGNGFHSGNRRAWRRALGGGLVLAAAGSLLLSLGVRRSGGNATAQLDAFPTLAAQTGARLITANSHSELRSVISQLPLIFEPNQGQADAGVRFLAHGIGYGLYLDSAGAVLAVPAPSQKSAPRVASLRLKLVDANPHSVLAGTAPLPGHSNYLIGNNPQKWHRDIPQFSGVRYQDIYPGIDLVFYGNAGQLEYDFHVAPGADASRAQMEFDGAISLKLSYGDLILNQGNEGRVLFHAPHIYQRFGDREQSVTGGFTVLAGNRAGFQIGPYDHSRELIIDPIPEIESYFGGSGSDTFPSLAVDPSATFIYLAGTTTSPQNTFSDFNSTTQTSIPSTLTISPTGPTHVFVAKISPSQPPVVEYETFLGGSASDTLTGVAVDGADDAYLVGNTASPDFPTTPTTAYQNAPETKTVTCTGTCSSLFVSVLDTAGTGFLNYSSYVSGDGNDVSTGMTIDQNFDVFITGTTTSNDVASFSDEFPASEAPPSAETAFQNSQIMGAPIQFFVTKVNTASASASSIAYSTYFGGGLPTNPTAVGGGIAIDAAGNIYFSGTTNFTFTGHGRPPDFPILNPYQPCLNNPPPLVIQNPPSCQGLTLGTNTDAFVAKINPNTVPGQQLRFSTYLGGMGNDSSTGLAIDSGAANIYVTGTTNSTDFIIPTGTAAFQSSNTCGICAYVGRFNNPASADMTLSYFSYLGGTSNDGVTSGLAVAVDTASGALLTGSTTSHTLPVTPPNGVIQSTLNGPQNAFFARIDTNTVSGQAAIGSYLTYFGGNGFDRGTSITIDANTNIYFAGDTTSTNLPTEDPILPTPPLNGTNPHEFFTKLGTAADLCMNCVAPTLSTLGEVPAGTPTTVTYTLLNNGPDLATDVIVTGSVSSSSLTIKSASATSGICTPQGSNGNIACTINTLQPGSTSLVKFNVVPSTVGNFEVTAMASSIFDNDQNPGNNVAQASFQSSNYSLSVTPSSQTVVAGQTASYSVAITPLPVYSAPVALTASGQPSATTVSFGATSVTPGQGPVATALNLATTPRLVPVSDLRRHREAVYALWLGLPGLGLLGIVGTGKRRRRHILGALMLLLCALIIFQPACSTGVQPTAVAGTPAGTYTITVTATSGTFNRTATVNLTVQ